MRVVLVGWALRKGEGLTRGIVDLARLKPGTARVRAL